MTGFTRLSINRRRRVIGAAAATLAAVELGMKASARAQAARNSFGSRNVVASASAIDIKHGLERAKWRR
jgi:hypothetical protein